MVVHLRGGSPEVSPRPTSEVYKEEYENTAGSTISWYNGRDYVEPGARTLYEDPP